MGMITAEQIEQWRGRPVVDSQDESIGTLDEVYYHSSGEPVLVRVSSGLMGRHQYVVPLAGASVSRDLLRLAYTRAQVEQAGSEQTDERLSAQDAGALSSAYGIALPGADGGYETSRQLERRRVKMLKAEQRAAGLDQQVQHLQGDAESAREKADRAAADAAAAEHDAESARRAAAAAHSEAQAANPDSQSEN